MKKGDLVTFSAYGKARVYNKDIIPNTHGIIIKSIRPNTDLESCNVMWFPAMEVRYHWRTEVKFLK